MVDVTVNSMVDISEAVASFCHVTPCTSHLKVFLTLTFDLEGVTGFGPSQNSKLLLTYGTYN